VRPLDILIESSSPAIISTVAICYECDQQQ